MLCCICFYDMSWCIRLLTVVVYYGRLSLTFFVL